MAESTIHSDDKNESKMEFNNSQRKRPGNEYPNFTWFEELESEQRNDVLTCWICFCRRVWLAFQENVASPEKW